MTKEIERLKNALDEADAVIIGAGAGLSTSAGFTYSGERFKKYFSDFAARHGYCDMYSGGFYPYKTLEEHWAYWSRYIMVNRYMEPPKPVYKNLLSLVSGKDYFVITTNVDHCFQKSGFDKKRLYYTQGDYGLFQCSEPCRQKTYDNEEAVRKMVEAQGIVGSSATMTEVSASMTHDAANTKERATVTEGSPVVAQGQPAMAIPSELVPRCPVCGKPMSMNLRADNTFVQDEGWYKAAKRYEEFLGSRKAAADGRALFLELGVGSNTPGIIKYPFWQMTFNNPNATYACVNFGEAVAPSEIESRSICINADIGDVVDELNIALSQPPLKS